MKKKNFVTLIVGVVGGLLFALGMCMCLVSEWNAFTPGVVIACLGLLVGIVLLCVRRRMDGKPMVHISGKTVGTVLYAVCSALILGVGMCMVLVWNMLLWGIVVGAVGIVLLLCLIPMVKGLK
ncbi:MAG: hypothetical protein Q4E21_07450 [Clostridia bacterium]|nr:hypothetical protein [Clostridia bacterium]